jgi:hypothetical protein
MEASPTERAFRAIESELDSMLAVAMPMLTAMGLAYTDRSTRTYHYKENYLRWEALFERRWQRDLFTQQAQITLSYGEPIDPVESPNVHLFRRVESFRQGQVSSLDDKHEESCSFEIVQAEGIAEVIKPLLVAAAALLDVTM